MAACTVIVAGAAVAYRLHEPKVYAANASIAIVQPVTNGAALGAPAAASPQQYVDAQVLLLQSGGVAAVAANLANATLHQNVFTAGAFSGPKSGLKVSTGSPTDPNTSVVNISFSARTSAEAAAGANALLTAYNNVRTADIQQTDNAVISAIDASVREIDQQLGALSAHGGALNAQLVNSLIAERTNLVDQRSLAMINEQASISQAPATISAYDPSKAANHKLTRVAPVGAVMGFLLGTGLAFWIEVRRRRRGEALDRLDARPGEPSAEGGAGGRPSPKLVWGRPPSADEPRELASGPPTTAEAPPADQHVRSLPIGSEPEANRLGLQVVAGPPEEIEVTPAPTPQLGALECLAAQLEERFTSLRQGVDPRS